MLNELRARRIIRRVAVLRLAKNSETAYEELKHLDKRSVEESDAPELNKELVHTMGDKTRIYLVDGKAVRDLYNTDFSMGGHGYVYDFIPKEEIWIERMYSTNESKDIELHELFERDKMRKQHKSYEQAHTEATELESEMRSKEVASTH